MTTDDGMSRLIDGLAHAVETHIEHDRGPAFFQRGVDEDDPAVIKRVRDLEVNRLALALSVERNTEHAGTWQTVDLLPVVKGERTEQPPALLARTDGMCLVYRNKSHVFAGEPESGKSWAAFAVCAEAICNGEHALYIDFEDRETTAVDRMTALGLDPNAIVERFHYIRPNETLTGAAVNDLLSVLDTYRPAVAIIDGVTEAMALHGLELVDSSDAAQFQKLLARRLLDHGCAVISIDHVTKTRDASNRFAFGAQHKLAGVDVQYLFEMIETFGRGKPGMARVRLSKDRPGYLWEHAPGKRPAWIADMHVATVDGVQITLSPPSAAPVVVDAFAERIEAIVEAGDEMTTDAIVKAVGAKRENVVRGLGELVEAGRLTMTPGARNKRLYRACSSSFERERLDLTGNGSNDG